MRHNNRLTVKQLFYRRLKYARQRRHHRTQNNQSNVIAFYFHFFKGSGKEKAALVNGDMVSRRYSDMTYKRLLVEDAEDGISIANVDCQEHDFTPRL
jgi:hypothetical protein